MAGDLQIERMSFSDVGPAERAAWSTLARRALEPNPFFEPEFVLPAARHLLGGARARLLVVRRGDDWLGCVPVLTRPKWSDVWLPCLRVWNHPYCFLSTPLVDRDALPAVAAALTAAPARRPARAFLALESMGEGRISTALLTTESAAGRSPVLHSGFRRATLTRRPENTYIADASSGKRRRELRRTRRILDETVGGAPVLSDVSSDPAALDRLLALEGAGWKGAAGTALNSDAAHEAFVREVWSGFAARGHGHLLELGIPGRVVASVLCLSAGDQVFSLKTGHDETLRSGTPGIHLMAEAAGWFHGRAEFSLFDSCAVGDNAMINALWPDRRGLVTPILPAGGLAGHVTRALLRLHDARAVARA